MRVRPALALWGHYSAAVAPGGSSGGGGNSSGPPGGGGGNIPDLASLMGTATGGLKQTLGLDGSVLSDPTQWASVKSLAAGGDWLGGLLGGRAHAAGQSTLGDTQLGGALGAIPGIGGLLGAIPTGKKMPGGGAAAGGTPNSDMLSSLLGAPAQRPGDPEFDRNMDGASSAAVWSRAVNKQQFKPPPDPALAIGEPLSAIVKLAGSAFTNMSDPHEADKPDKKTVQAGYAPGGNAFDAKQYAPASNRNGGGADQQGGVDNSITVNATGMDENKLAKRVTHIQTARARKVGPMG